jgi:flagellar protein FliS
VEGNLKSDMAQLQEAKDIVTELRDAWAQAMKKARAEKKPQGTAAVLGGAGYAG